MPLPVLFIGIAAAAGFLGTGMNAKAVVDNVSANNLNRSANELIGDSTKLLNSQRLACGDALSHLGSVKLFVLNSSMAQFLDSFSKIKNVDFRASESLDELNRLHVDAREFTEMKELVNFAGNMAGGAVAGAASGALIAFGAYGAAQALACASTGTAISALSGAAAANATLAFFGGGALAAGGLGMAGGAAVLGGLVAGPALAVMGLIAGSAARRKLDGARTNRAEALRTAAGMNATSMQCEAIRRRTCMFYNLLVRLDSFFLPLIYRMEDIVQAEGCDYSAYCEESKQAIAACASVAVSMKSVLDTPLLTDDGLLTDESARTAADIEDFLREAKKAD